MATATQKFGCPECGKWHDGEYAAMDCCDIQVTIGWECDHCEAVHKKQEEAEKCCADKFICRTCDLAWESPEEASNCCGIPSGWPTPAELEKAGQQRIEGL